jgi:hypothetical protein
MGATRQAGVMRVVEGAVRGVPATMPTVFLGGGGKANGLARPHRDNIVGALRLVMCVVIACFMRKHAGARQSAGGLRAPPPRGQQCTAFAVLLRASLNCSSVEDAWLVVLVGCHYVSGQSNPQRFKHVIRLAVTRAHTPAASNRLSRPAHTLHGACPARNRHPANCAGTLYTPTAATRLCTQRARTRKVHPPPATSTQPRDAAACEHSPHHIT